MRYTEQQAREKIVETGLDLLRSGLTIRTWGNISARIDDDTILITPSGRGYDVLTPEDITLLHLNDMSWEGKYKPSSEKKVHAEIYRQRTDVDYIIHTHQYMASAVSIAGRDLVLWEEEHVKELGNTVPCAGYGMSSTKMLEKAVAECLKENLASNNMLMRAHGALIFGEDKEQTMRRVLMLEQIMKDLYDKKDPEGICREKYGDAEAPEDLGSSIRTSRGILIHKKTGEYLIKEDERTQSVTDRTHWNVYHMSHEAGCVRHITHPAVITYSLMGKEMPAVLDDVAQITGYSVPWIDGMDNPNVSRLLLKHHMVLMGGNGALVMGPDEEEAEARAQILIKGAYTALYQNAIGGDFRVSYLDASLQKTFYERKYSKLKE